MRLTLAFAIAAAFAFATAEKSQGFSSVLSDESLAAVSGRSQDNKSESASDACEDSTTSGTADVSEWECVGYPDGTACVQCTCGAQIHGLASTSGGPGLDPKTTVIACQNCTGKYGLCNAGSCYTMDPASCSGKPSSWNAQ